MPVYENTLLREGSWKLGRRIREERKKQALTLQHLSAKVGISVTSLSDIENDKVGLDLERLVQIAGALGVRVDALLPRSRRSHFQVTRRSDMSRPASKLNLVDQATRRLTPYHNGLRGLAEPFIGKHIDPLYIEVRPVTDEAMRFITHHHEEFFFVLRGEVECTIQTPQGVVREVLGPCDSMYFWSHLPHCVRSTSAQVANTLHVHCSTHGLIEWTQAVDDAGGTYFMSESRRSLTESVGQRILALRRVLGVSAGEFAKEVGIGARRMTEIERGRQPVPVDLLVAISRKCRRPLEYFLAGALAEAPFHAVVRAGEIAGLPARFERQAGDPPSEFRSLAAGFAHRSMYPAYGRLQNGTTDRLHEHPGQEFVFVLNGEVTFRTVLAGEPVEETLAAGDACLLDSAVPHRFSGGGLSVSGSASAEIIAVQWCPLGEDYLFPLVEEWSVEGSAGGGAHVP